MEDKHDLASAEKEEKQNCGRQQECRPQKHHLRPGLDAGISLM